MAQKEDLYRFIKEVTAKYPDNYAGLLGTARKANCFRVLGHLYLELIKQIGPCFVVSGPMTNGGEGDFIKNLYALANVGFYYQDKCGMKIFPQFLFEETAQEIWSVRSRSESVEELTDSLFNDMYYPVFAHKNMEGVIFTTTWDTSAGARREHDWFNQKKDHFTIVYASDHAQSYKKILLR
jgi:hypothetical protein